MFGIGPTELIIILVIALLVLGPKRLPELARSLGRGLAEFRRATSDITDEIDDARNMITEETRKATSTASADADLARARKPKGAQARTDSAGGDGGEEKEGKPDSSGADHEG